jgi:hypothetical protein
MPLVTHTRHFEIQNGPDGGLADVTHTPECVQFPKKPKIKQFHFSIYYIQK